MELGGIQNRGFQSLVFTQSSAPHTPLRETKSVPHTGEAGRRLIRGPRQGGQMLPILPDILCPGALHCPAEAL